MRNLQFLCYNFSVNKLKKFWKRLGPGFITGASDNDPSGIATYSIAGAKAGLSILWTMPYLLPLMVAMQEMAAKIGIASACGLAGNLKRYYSKALLIFVASLIIISNVFNIGADISGMSAAVNLLIPGPARLISTIIVLTILYFIVVLPYKKIVSVLKWLSITLFAYVVAALTVSGNWSEIIFKTFIPHLKFSKEYAVLIVAILGTTISPYLAFWQANEEAEEKREQYGNRSLVCKFRPLSKTELSHMKTDTRLGMFFSNFIAFFIIVLTSTVLFGAGITNLETIRDAAEALRPLAGQYSYILFTIGLVTSGLLAIPILAGSAAYVISEIFGWEASLDDKFSKARQFYIVLVASALIGLIIPMLGISPIKALFYTAILHGIVAPFLIGVLIHMSNNPAIVGPNINSHRLNVAGYATMLILIGGVATFFLTL